MALWSSTLPLERILPAREPKAGMTPAGPSWRTLSPAARIYITTIIGAGVFGLIAFFPRTPPPSLMFAVLLVFACVTSTWKVNLPISVTNGSTLSVSYAANLMSLLLLGAPYAVIVAVAGAWTQCWYKPKEPYPLYRTMFSMAGAVITMELTGAAYVSLGGVTAPFEAADLARPLVAAIATYFFVNTTMVAGAIALTTDRTFARIWREDFLWSAASFMAAGTAGALAAIVVARGSLWKALLMVAPIYLTYHTYRLFVGRLEDQKRHMTEMRRLHDGTIAALAQAHAAEHALATEKHRLAAALEDMTRLEQVRNDLLEREHAARASAEEANHLKDQFLAVVSHELRTPLNAILGWADMLWRGKVDPGLHERAFRTIYGSAKRQAELIEDLLDVSRIMSGKLRLDRTIVNFEDVVRDALQVVQPAADTKDVRITVRTDRSIGPVHGDGARLQQIVWNLLSNAVKFTPNGGRVGVRIRREEDVVELVVTDTGQGIPESFLPSVFEAFRQADASTTRPHRGLGLGLSIVKNLVEAHGGTISAGSGGEGKGATFVVRLPIAVRTDAPAVSAPIESVAHQAETPAPLEGLSVLIVDDDAESLEIEAAHLEGSRARVLSAVSAAQALEVLDRHHVDVLIADIGMPDEDGYALIRKVRARTRDASGLIPAAALTAFAREEDRQLALAAGFQLHLAKPIDGPALVAAVASLARLNVT